MWSVNGTCLCVLPDVSGGEECKYPGHCTFAYCQEEIDVWTLERKGFITRDLLVNPQDASKSINFTVSKILQEHQGMFIFLCEVSLFAFWLAGYIFRAVQISLFSACKTAVDFVLTWFPAFLGLRFRRLGFFSLGLL